MNLEIVQNLLMRLYRIVDELTGIEKTANKELGTTTNPNDKRIKDMIKKEKEVIGKLLNIKQRTEKKSRVDRLQEKFIHLWALQEQQEGKNKIPLSDSCNDN